MSKLECRNLSVDFASERVLNDVSLVIPSNQITAFIGPSGCGKTTLLKCFNRMNDLSFGYCERGEILLDGAPLRNMATQDLRRKVGMVFQRPTPFAMSIYQNVAFGPKGNGIKEKEKLDEIVEKSLKDASLWQEVKDRLHNSARGLSGGQQQRLCIARALAVSPQVLLLDEPTSALDPISTAHIEELLLSLSGQLTMVLVSHNMQQVCNLSSKTAYFEKGELIECDTTEKIFKSPKNKKTALYVQR